MNYSVTAPFIEQRLKPRMICNYQALVKGHEDGGKEFKEEGRVVNLSRSGIFILLHRTIPESCEVSVRIVLPTGVLEVGSSNLAIKGTVVRSETREDGAFGVAIHFQNYRMM